MGREWLTSQPNADQVLNRFLAVDRLVFDELHPFEDCLWEIPGLEVAA